MENVLTVLLLLYIVGVIGFTVWFSVSAEREIRRTRRLTKEIEARTARVERETALMRSRR